MLVQRAILEFHWVDMVSGQYLPNCWDGPGSWYCTGTVFFFQISKFFSLNDFLLNICSFFSMFKQFLRCLDLVSGFGTGIDTCGFNNI